MPTRPEFEQMEMTHCLREHVLAVEELLQTHNLGLLEAEPVVKTLGDLVSQTERYLESLDPEGWSRAQAELALLRRKGEPKT